VDRPQPLRIALVDDNPDERTLARRRLRQAFAGWEIVEVSDPEGFERLLRGRELGAVVTDYQLGWSDGLEVLRRVREVLPECAVVMFTGTGSQEVAVEAMKAGLDDYVLKAAPHYVRLPVAGARARARRPARAARAQMRREIRDRERLLAATFRCVSEGLLVTDASGLVRMMNPTAEALTGWTEGAAFGRPFEEVLRMRGPDGEPLSFSKTRIALSGKSNSPDDRDYLLETRKGERIPVMDGASPLLDGDRVEGAVVSLRPIADRKRAERELEAAHRALQTVHLDQQQFAYAVSHDLQEPLRQIRAFSTLLVQRHRDRLDADGREYLDFVETGAARLDAMMARLRTYLRLAAVDPSDVAPVEAGRVLESVLAGLERPLAESGGRVEADPLPAVRMEEVHLFQVLQNLIGNAIKYRGKAPPHVRVTASRAGDGWAISVRDNGVGFDPAHSEEVFKVFRRLHSERYDGAGMGLAIAHRIVERYGGRMWAESSPGRGSTFSFTAPA
jgi:PAS domain S-box-containing protein